MAKIKWTKYFMVRPGQSKHFAIAGRIQSVNLNNENLSVEFVKSLYDKGIKNIILTEEGEKKFGLKTELKRARKGGKKNTL
jgi:hypothetical protein